VDAANFILLDQAHQPVLAGDQKALQKPDNSTILIVAPILLLIGLACIGSSISIIVHAFVLNNFGLDAKGTLMDKVMYGSGGKGTTFQAFYAFVADNYTYFLQAPIDGQTYSTVNIGDHLDVKHMAGNPNDARLMVYNPEERDNLSVGFVVGIPCFGVAVLAIFTARQRVRNWQLLVGDGQLLEGHIVSLKMYPARRGYDSYLVMKYEFASPSNRLLKGKTKLDDERAYNQVTTGMSLVVLYVHDRLFQVL
jgi:hypothetical protein